MKTKTNKFNVIKLVEIPISFLNKRILNELDGREISVDIELDEKIYGGDIFEAIACEQAEMPTNSPLRISEEDLATLNMLAEELGEYELVKVNVI